MFQQMLIIPYLLIFPELQQSLVSQGILFLTFEDCTFYGVCNFQNLFYQKFMISEMRIKNCIVFLLATCVFLLRKSIVVDACCLTLCNIIFTSNCYYNIIYVRTCTVTCTAIGHSTYIPPDANNYGYLCYGYNWSIIASTV